MTISGGGLTRTIDLYFHDSKSSKSTSSSSSSEEGLAAARKCRFELPSDLQLDERRTLHPRLVGVVDQSPSPLRGGPLGEGA